jgi:hypothetical protein
LFVNLDDGPSRARDGWQQSPGGRVVLGTLLALGLCYGTLQMGMACLRAMGIDAASGQLDPLTGLLLFQGLQVVAVFAGGLLAGAGQERGSLLGGTVGLLCGVGVLAAMLGGVSAGLIQSYSSELLSPGTPTHDMIMFSLPVQHLVIGALGGFVAAAIWPPLVAATDPRYSSLGKRKPARRDPNQPAFAHWTGPISWVRVVIGTAIAVFGAINTPTMIEYGLRLSEYKIQLMTQLENQVAYGQVFGLSILLGGCFAGATRVNGLKQGLVVGVLVAIIMAGSFMKVAAEFAPSVMFPILSALLLGPVGGWFGSELLPPVGKSRFRVRVWS